MDSDLIFHHECIVLDACSVINLYATGRMSEIIKSIPLRFFISSYVKEEEARSLSDGVGSDGTAKRIPIDLQPMIDQGLLEICHHDSPMIANKIIILASAGIRGMGEKISGAIALENNWAIATDDRHAISKLAHTIPNNQIITTLDIVRYWADIENIQKDAIREVINQIITRGNYTPSETHHLYSWIVEYMN